MNHLGNLTEMQILIQWTWDQGKVQVSNKRPGDATAAFDELQCD